MLIEWETHIENIRERQEYKIFKGNDHTKTLIIVFCRVKRFATP
jgi:hypothetical protein